MRDDIWERSIEGDSSPKMPKIQLEIGLLTIILRASPTVLRIAKGNPVLRKRILQ